jgi:hypothetical protein
MSKRYRPLRALRSPKAAARKWEGWTVVSDKKATGLLHRILKGL